MAERLVNELTPLGEVRSKKMFGGYGVFCEDVMFVLIDPSGAPYLRADDTTSPEFEAEGCERHGRMPYWRVPAAVLDDAAQLDAWARRALGVARAAKR